MAESLSESPPQQGPMCPVCFRDYSDSDGQLVPRILQCGHTYCTECLGRLLNMEVEGDDDPTMFFNIQYAGRQWMTTRRFPSLFNRPRPPRNEIKCPTCKMLNRIDNRDITSLTKNFALLGLKTQASINIHPKKSHYCKDHDHEKRIYCRDCKTLICAYCQLYGDHQGHQCVIATDAAQPSIEALKEAKEKLEKDFESLSEGESVVKEAVEKLERTKERCKKKVKKYFDRFVVRLERKRDDFLWDIDRWSEDQMSVLEAQLKSLSSAVKDSETIQTYCQSMIEGDPLEALAQEDDILREVDDIQDRVSGLSFHPLINPWMKCKVTLSEYDDPIDEIFDGCHLKFDRDSVHDGAAVSTEDENSMSSDQNSDVIDDDGDDSDADDSIRNLTFGESRDHHMSFQDQAGSRVGTGRNGGASVSGGASLNFGQDEDIDALKKSEQQKAAVRLLHLQETHDGGNAVSLVPTLEVADQTGEIRWGYHPSNTSTSSHGIQQSLPILSANQSVSTSGGGARNSLGRFGSTPSNTPQHGGSASNGATSPAQASQSSTSMLFNPSMNSNYNQQHNLSDRLQETMRSLSHAIEELSDEEDDDLDGESRHRLHLIENLSPSFDQLLDMHSHLRVRDVARENSVSSSSHDEDSLPNVSLNDVDDSDNGSPSPQTYPGRTFVSTSVLDSIEAIRRSRRLLERMGERTAGESEDDDDEATADQLYLDSTMNTTGHPSSPDLPPRSRDGHSPSPSPLQTTDHEDTDFACSHHLSLPVDSHDQDTEIVFPRHYSWTADHGEAAGGDDRGGRRRGGGRGIHLQLEQNGTTLQLSIDSPGMDMSNLLNVSTEMDDGDGEREEDTEDV